MPVKSRSNATLINMNAKTGEFVVVKKIDGEYKKVSKADAYEGNLVGFKFSTYEYEGREKFKVTLKFNSKEDGTELVSMTSNNVTASILNKLASVDDLTNLRIEIRLYKNKKDYIADFVGRVGDEEGLSWKYDYKKLSSVMSDKERLKKFIDRLEDKIDKDQVTIEELDQSSSENNAEEFYKNAANDANDISNEEEEDDLFAGMEEEVPSAPKEEKSSGDDLFDDGEEDDLPW